MNGLIDKPDNGLLYKPVNGLYVGRVMYADDLLLSASLTFIHQIITTCELEAHYLDLNFKDAKSTLLRTGVW